MKKVISEQQQLETIDVEDVSAFKIYILINDLKDRGGNKKWVYILRRISIERSIGWIWVAINSRPTNLHYDVSVPTMYKTGTKAIKEVMRLKGNTVYEFDSLIDVVNKGLKDIIKCENKG